MQFVISQKAAIVFANGAIYSLPEQLEKRGLKKALLIVTPHFVKNGLADKLSAMLAEKGISAFVYGNVKADAPDYTVMEAVAIAKAEDVDCIVGIGGGSALDTAKAVNVMIHTDKPMLTYADPRVPHEPGAFLVLCPTTSGTGSEVTNGAMIDFVDLKRKMGIAGANAQSNLAIVDPALTMELSKALTASTGIDALTHAVGSITGAFKDNMVSEALSVQVIKLVLEYLPKVLDNLQDVEAREMMSYCGLVAGMAFADKPPHIDHCLAHTIGALTGTPHGEACAATLPLSIKYIAEAAPAKVKVVADAMGICVEGLDAKAAGNKVADAISSFVSSLGLRSFKELGFDEATVEKIAEVTPNDVTAFCCPRKITKEDVLELLINA